jgi:hypothetical protein
MNRQFAGFILVLATLAIVAACLLCAEANGAESIEVTPRLVSIAPVKYKDSNREGFALKVAWETKDGRFPNRVSFIFYTSLKGWELLHGNNSIMCENAPQVAYICTRPTSAVVTLHFARYDFVLTEADKPYWNPEPQPFDEFRVPLEDYFFIKVQYAWVSSEADMVEEEFCEAISQYQLKHDIRFWCSMSNTRTLANHQPDKPLVVEYWADLSEQDIKQGQDFVKRLAQQFGVNATTKKGDRLWKGGAVPEAVESVDLPKRGAAK